MSLQRRPSWIETYDESEPYWKRAYNYAKHEASDIGTSIYTSLTTLADVKEPEWKRQQRLREAQAAALFSTEDNTSGVEMRRKAATVA